MPAAFVLAQNYPNPFNPSTTIRFRLLKPAFVTLEVYNLLGKKVTTLIQREMNSGAFAVKFEASNLSSGIYYYKMQAGEYQAVKKMMLLQ